MTTTDICVAERIKYLREQLKLNQAQLARHLGTTRTTVMNWEAGVSYPSLPFLTSLADFFSVSVDYLVGKDERNFIALDGLREGEKDVVSYLIYVLRNNHVLL